MNAAGLKKRLTLKEAKAGYARYLDGTTSRPRPSFDWWWYLEEVDVSVDNHLQFEQWIALHLIKELLRENEQQEQFGSDSAFQVDNLRVEYINPDYSFAYASLISDVAAAAAYLDCGEIDKAKKALSKALISIDLFRKQNWMYATAATEQHT